MIRSRQIRIRTSGDEISDILAEAESFASDLKLSHKDALRVRLLSEETLSMLHSLTDGIEFEMEFTGREDSVIIEVETETHMNAAKKQEILSVSSTGKNISSRGITGKIRDVLETAFTIPDRTPWTGYCSPAMMAGYPGDISEVVMDNVYWSLATYKKNLNAGAGEGECEGDTREEWDELEKSIISNIADDVMVGVRGGHVVMVITYKIG